MTLRKLADEPMPCAHPEHEPPKHIMLSPGTYEHTCPSCLARVIFQVRGVYLGTADGGAYDVAVRWNR